MLYKMSQQAGAGHLLQNALWASAGLSLWTEVWLFDAFPSILAKYFSSTVCAVIAIFRIFGLAKGCSLHCLDCSTPRNVSSKEYVVSQTLQPSLCATNFAQSLFVYYFTSCRIYQFIMFLKCFLTVAHCTPSTCFILEITLFLVSLVFRQDAQVKPAHVQEHSLTSVLT